MESELAIEASREAIKVCLLVGGPILAVCLIVGLLMGLAQAMSHVQDQALATIPKILAIFAVVGFALPWFADRMMEFSKDQFSRPAFMEARTQDPPTTSVQSLLEPKVETDTEYYPSLNVPRLQTKPVVHKASFIKQPVKIETDRPGTNKSQSPFSLPSYRFTRRPSKNIEG